VSGKISGATNNQPPSAAAGSVGQRAAATASPAPNGASATASATGNATATAAANANASAGSAESVQITDTASHLVTAEQALNDVPVINPGRVSQARESLASGTYRISPERISNQLLQFERLLPEESVE
jgi:negative regulator of flagellin synthesis FlgM